MLFKNKIIFYIENLQKLGIWINKLISRLYILISIIPIHFITI